ncbi:MAG TPA: ABC transporter permease [Candidatus Angelobacter sp.]|nr:ABC transporter permease [Candidatus Angelobacter sp.]
MHALTQHLLFAIRQLRKSLGFSLTVVLTLALGIGATTAIFSLVEGILLRPLPFTDPDRLVLLGDHLRTGSNTSVTAREIAIYSGAASAFSSMGAYITGNYEVSGGATPEEIPGARMTASIFPTLGVNPLLGRVFTPQEDQGSQPLAVISYSLWLTRYGRDPHIVGRSIALNRKNYSIIGVMPRDFEFPPQPGRLAQAQLWVPMSLTPDDLSDSSAGFWGYQMVARIKDGVTPEQARRDADRVAQLVMRGFPVSMSALHITGDAMPLGEFIVGNVRPLLRALLLAVAVVLIIACVNVAGVLLVRAIGRRREYAVRLALGARPGTILRQSLLEGLLLSVTGGLLGLFLAAGAIRAALHLLPESMPRIDSIYMDSNIAIFAFVLALVSGALCSLAPAFAALRTNLTQSLKDDVRSSTGAAGHTWLRSSLVVAEIAIALVLVTVSGAFLSSFEKMRAVNPGFTPDHLLLGHFRLHAATASAENFDRELIDRLSRQPGITAVGLGSVLPAASGQSPQAAYTIEDMPVDRWKLKFAAFQIIYGDYFRAMGIPVLEGRTFTLDDRTNAPLVVIVNQSMARNCWPGQSPLGKRIHMGNPKKGLPWATVVGVVADTKIGSRDEPSLDQWYLPALQPAILGAPDIQSGLSGGFLALRSVLPPEQMIQTLRSTVNQIDPLLALQQVQPMTAALSNVEAPRRFNTDLITAFALGALLLALTGIYAVVAFSVSIRAHEIAIRMALGAQRTGIARLVLLSGAKLALLGCALGVLGSLAASRLVSSFLFEVSATDPIIYLSAVAIMMLLALLASALPATRAASAEPVDALRTV